MIEYKKRKLQQVNKTLWMSIPSAWAKQHGLKKGDILQAATFKRGRLVVWKDGENDVLEGEHD